MNKENKAYEPISCSFHDLLLAKATLQEKVEVAYRLLGGGDTLVQAVIQDVFTRDKEEFMVLDNGDCIRLDRIIRVNDQFLAGANSCRI